jgi:TetR/AcrR family transcriptional regulator, transcriptional repressor for nem operon
MGRSRQFDIDVATQGAVEVFRRKGYGATTPQDLLDALGIGKGSLYHAFGSKHGLFEQALQRYGQHRVGQLRAALAGPGPVRDRLLAALTRPVEDASPNGSRLGCLAVNTAAELAAVDPVAARLTGVVFDGIEKAFRLAVEEGQAAGEIEPDQDPAALAALLLSATTTIALLSRSGSDPQRLHRVAGAAVAAVRPARAGADQ